MSSSQMQLWNSFGRGLISTQLGARAKTGLTRQQNIWFLPKNGPTFLLN